MEITITPNDKKDDDKACLVATTIKTTSEINHSISGMGRILVKESFCNVHLNTITIGVILSVVIGGLYQCKNYFINTIEIQIPIKTQLL